MVKPRYPLDELARMGDAIYERDILPRMTAEDTGRIVAIDVDTGTYAIDSHLLAAADRIAASKPDAQLWFRRVGSTFVHRLGHRTAVRPAE
jgi:hypothetical protein